MTLHVDSVAGEKVDGVEEKEDLRLSMSSKETSEHDLAPVDSQPESTETGDACIGSGSEKKSKGKRIDFTREVAGTRTESVDESCGSEDSLPVTALHALSPRRALTSTTTLHSTYTVHDYADFNGAKERRRPKLMSRLRSQASSKPAVRPADFQLPVEEPEKRFVDDIGMIFPGVSDRAQCPQSRPHHVSTFRLCEPIEYSTPLADHGVTFADYNRLIELLAQFLQNSSTEDPRRDSGNASLSSASMPAAGMKPKQTEKTEKRSVAYESFFDVTEHFGRDRNQADSLNQLLEEVTFALQERGVPVVICVSSYSLFAPSRISEAHVQILHVTPKQLKESQSTLRTSRTFSVRSSWRVGQRLSFMRPPPPLPSEQPCARPRPTAEPEPRADSEQVADAYPSPRRPFNRSQSRDQSQPYPLWPNAIPSRMRETMHANLERYGTDPYFRAWMRANIDSGTQSSTSYQAYLTETAGNLFTTKRLDYFDTAVRKPSLLRKTDRTSNGKDNNPVRNHPHRSEKSNTTVNRARYEHNRTLECRKATETSSRLRLVRFAFRHPIYPPHTPEMQSLGLTRPLYQSILRDIHSLHETLQGRSKCPFVGPLRHALDKVWQRRTDEACQPELRAYVRRLNARHRRVVWTVERVPGVYERGGVGGREEWEVSAWKCEEPLELLVDLERWGIVEKRVTLGE
ncbi:hypothetical protein IAQ61_009086 [Plenodomus lingam]|uniref:uncharacterized protein n=1 Tax=Leptosphaeria maculans TaxID=5022 RepID=UPI00331B4E7F|nr:hypothetical protein IAQ61_009086 [Plenodomus lingam]